MAAAGEPLEGTPAPSQTRPSDLPTTDAEGSAGQSAAEKRNGTPEPSPLPESEQLSPADPVLLPGVEPLPNPLLDPARTADRRDRVSLRDENPDEVPPTPAPDLPESFIVPGFYGSAPRQFTPGEGRLAALPFQTILSVGAGYDDNLRASTSGRGAEKVGSGFTNARLATSYQTAGLMQFFILDAAAGVDLYWSDEDPDFDLSLGLSYQRRFVSPLKVSANVGVSYQTQPNYAQVNLARGAAGEDEEDSSGVLSASAKLDLSYAWTAQFTTLTSFSADTILYGGDRSDADSIDLTIGNELRYRVDRYTWIAEARYQFNARPNSEELEADTVFLLAGAEWHLRPWLQLSARLGASLRSYQDGGETTSPHGEFAVTFAPTPQNSFSLNARYGLERTALNAGDSETFRVGGTYTRVFTSRLSGTLALSYLQSEQAGTTGGFGLEEDGGGDERIFDATLSLNYRLTSRLGLSASITCTRGNAASGLADPDRNRFVVNADYRF